MQHAAPKPVRPVLIPSTGGIENTVYIRLKGAKSHLNVHGCVLELHYTKNPWYAEYAAVHVQNNFFTSSIFDIHVQNRFMHVQNRFRHVQNRFSNSLLLFTLISSISFEMDILEIVTCVKSVLNGGLGDSWEFC